jgi:hypothetical protein
MNTPFTQKAGIALIIFTILLVFTIVLHPAGGSIGHLINMTMLIIVTHSIAILSLPVGGIGFWGLTVRIGADRFGSMLAFGMAVLGLVAALLAGATNGLVMPIFLQQYKDATPEAIAAIKPLLQYGFAVNHAFDYVYTGAFALAILCWSIEILLTRRLAPWLGWLGIVISLIVAVIFCLGEPVNSVHGLRIFVVSIIGWILLVGAALRKSLSTSAL